MKLTTDALYRLAAEETVFPDSKDALDRLAFLTGPVFFSVPSGRRITGPIASDLIAQNFELKLPHEVCESLIFRLAKLGFLAKEIVGDAPVFVSKGKRQEERKASAIDEIIRDFRLSVSDKELLPRISDDEVLDLFLREIFELVDFLEDDHERRSDTRPDQWKVALISDYVISNTDADGSLPPLLTKLAELCLMRSLVDNLARKNRAPKKSTLVAILDAPIALFSTGASGELQERNTNSTLKLARSLGVRTAMIPTSIQEYKRVLYAVLNTDHRDRRGYTAAAIRRGELIEPIARDMLTDPEKYAKSCEISVIPRTLQSFPSEEKFWPIEEYEEFSAIASRWANSRDGQNHDSECLAVTMRARKGKHARDMLDNDYVFVTGNWSFVSAARRLCLETFRINEDHCPPVVHINSFAASVWMSGGFNRAERIPERTLLAACERAMAGHAGVIEKAGDLFSKLEGMDEATLELLLQDRNSVNAMAKSVAFDPSLISEENISVILVKAKEAIALEVSKKANKEKAALVEQYGASIAEAQSEANIAGEKARQDLKDLESELNSRNERLENSIAQLESDREQEAIMAREAISNRVNKVNRHIDRHGWSFVEWLHTTFFTVASILTVFTASWMYGLAMLAIGLVVVLFSYFEIWFPKRFKSWAISRHAMKQVHREFSGAEIQRWGIAIDDDAEVVVRRQ